MKKSVIKQIVFLAILLSSVLVQASTAQENPARSERIVFGVGETRVTKSGSLRGADFDEYSFTASAGQNITLTLTTKKNVNFTLLDKTTMEALEGDLRPMTVRDWSGVLPKNGEYLIRVFMMPRTGSENRKASYKLAVEIKNPDGNTTSVSPDVQNTVNYICASNTDLRADYLKNGSVRIRFSGQDVILPPVQSANGAKYEQGRFLFWSKGPEATLESPVLSGNCQEK